MVISNYFGHNVGRNAAALAYYLLFALFPILIFVSNLLGVLELDIASITESLQSILPDDIVNLLSTYLEYVSGNSSHTLMWFSLVFSIYFPMRAAKGLMDSVRRAYQLPKPKNPITYIIRQLAYTVVLLVIIALSLLVSTSGQRVLGYIISVIPALESMDILDFLVSLWHYLRFIILAVIMFVALGGLYALSQDERTRITALLPGVVFALTAWLAVSICFSFYVENFGSYTVIYGTLGTVIALLIWLYLTSVILILGAELNAALRTSSMNKKRGAS